MSLPQAAFGLRNSLHDSVVGLGFIALAAILIGGIDSIKSTHQD